MILFDVNEKNFTTNGLGRLTDAISCTVTEERNGVYELALQYPVTGRKYKQLTDKRIIYAKHSDGADMQPFRIYKITKPMNGVVDVYAEHISYQLSKIPVMPFTANSVAAALEGLKENAAEDCPFGVWTDKTTTATFKVTHPASFRSLLGGTEGSILDVYGKGDYEWDKWTVKLHGNRGKDSGVEIRYGKNLLDLEATSDSSGIYTGVCPYWRGEEGDVVTLPEKVLHNTTQYSYPMTVPLDLSSEFENKPTEAQLRIKAQSYLSNNNGWELNENIKISFVALWQTKEYESIAPLQRLSLCDTATVIHDKLGVSVKAKVVKTVYNVLLNRYDEIELGETRTNLSDTVKASLSKKIKEEVPSKTYLREAIDRATQLIQGGLGGHLIIGTNANGEPNELLIMDTADKNTCVNCIRINANGIGFSTTGYNGTFRTAWTLDGHFVADFIDSGILSANVIKAGLLQDKKGKCFWNLETGEFQMSSETITVDGKEVATLDDVKGAEQIAQSAIKGVRVEYAYSSSPTTAPAKNSNLWSTQAPEWQNGRYVWQRTVTTTSSESLYSDAVCISGAKGDTGERGLQGLQGEKGDQGIQGAKGAKGASTYFHIAYAKSADGSTGFSTSDPTDRDYIGTYVDTTAADSTDPGKYTWQLVKGAQGEQGEKGIAGKNGVDGKTSYLHIAYATSSDGKTGFSTTVSSGKTYIGQYVDFTEADSTDYTKYSWTLIKGDKGDRGIQGLQGEKGDQGIQGAKGDKGADGVSTYFHIAYANSSDGKTGFSISDPTNRDYIGTYVDSTKTDSTVPSKYTWQLVKGAQGVQGEKGIAGKNGADGKTQYLHLAYATSADGKTGFSTTISEGKTYIGQYVDFTEADSTDYKKYAWTLIKGEDGKSVVAVQNVYLASDKASGITSNKGYNYLMDVDAPSLSKVNAINNRYFSDAAVADTTVMEYVKLTSPPAGVTNGVRFTVNEAVGKPRSICWYSGSHRVPLVDGKMYTVSCYARVTSGSKVRVHFRTGVNAYPVYKNEDITETTWKRLSCTFIYNAKANKDTTGQGARVYVGVTSTYVGACELCGFQLEEGDVTSDLLPESPGWNTAMPTLTASKKYLWQYEVITYSDGTYTETAPCVIGTFSNDGRGVKSLTEYYAINNSTTAPADSEFSTTVKATTTANKYLWNYEVTEMTDGTKITSKKHIISTHGATGATGATGNGIKTVTINYAVSTSNTTAPTSGWATSVPSVAQGFYLWTRTLTSMTDGTSCTSYSVARQGEKGATGATGAAGVGVKSTAVTYQSGSSGTTIPTGTWVTSIPSVGQGQYLWTRTVITYTDSKTSTAYSVSRNGKDGTSVTAIDVEYAQSTLSSTAPTSGWQTTAPAWVSGKYIWQRTVTKYSSGSSDTSKAVCITGEKGATGAKGATGDKGIGVKAITEQYYLSTSKTAQTGGSWVATAPAYKTGCYYWTRSKIDWTDNTTTYTSAVLSSGVNSANEKIDNLSVGGRNLVLYSDFSKGKTDGIITISGDEIIFNGTAVGNTVTPYTLNLGLSDFAKTNVRGKKITISMDYKVDSAVTFGSTNPWVGAQLTIGRNDTTGGSKQLLDLLGGTKIPTAVTGKWVRVTASYTVTDYDVSSLGLKFWFRDAKGKVRFRHPKVEIGNVATDYSPAPEDGKAYTDAQIVVAKSEIKKTTDSISLEVSKKVGANEIISKINQTAETVTIAANKINFNGMITANKTFKIDTSGYMAATGGKVGGWKITSNSLENTETATYVKLNSGSFTQGTWSGENIFAIGTKGSDGKVAIRWGVDQYGVMTCQSLSAESLTLSKRITVNGTSTFVGVVNLTGGVVVSNDSKNNFNLAYDKVKIIHNNTSYSLISFIKKVANGTIT